MLEQIFQLSSKKQLTHSNCNKMFVFLDDISVVTKGQKREYETAPICVSVKLNNKNLAISLNNFKLSC